MVKHMEVAGDRWETLCHVKWRYLIHIHYDPATVTCKRCLAIMRKRDADSAHA